MNLPIQIAIRCSACNSDLVIKSDRVVRGAGLSTEINVAPCQVCLDRREHVTRSHCWSFYGNENLKLKSDVDAATGVIKAALPLLKSNADEVDSTEFDTSLYEAAHGILEPHHPAPSFESFIICSECEKRCEVVPAATMMQGTHFDYPTSKCCSAEIITIKI